MDSNKLLLIMIIFSILRFGTQSIVHVPLEIVKMLHYDKRDNIGNGWAQI